MFPDTDAELLAIELSKALLPPPDLYNRIHHDLDVIRQAYPAMGQIHHGPAWALGELIVRLTPAAMAQYEKGEYHGLDSLMVKYGPIKTQTLFQSLCLVHLKFSKRYNPEVVVPIINEADGVVYTNINYRKGDGNRIKVTQEGYIYSLGWGDCPSGCISRHEWTFFVMDEQVELVRESGDPLITDLSVTSDGPTVIGTPTKLMAKTGWKSYRTIDYTWDFGDGTFGKGKAVDHIYPAAGNYTAVVTASSFGTSIEAATTVVVNSVSANALEPVDNSDLQAVVEGNTAFAFDLYAALRTAEGNLFFSPYSISAALAMTYAGARKNTTKQMAQTLHFPIDQSRLHHAFAGIDKRLRPEDQATRNQLNIANSLWPQMGYPFLAEFSALLKKYYGASTTAVDFSGDTETARQTINTWIAAKTQGKINELLRSGILKPLTRLVLVNAIYFKGTWASPFNKHFTRPDRFQLTSEETVEIPMMIKSEKFKYYENDEFQMLELPYEGDALSMILLLPREIEGLPDLEGDLTLANFQKWSEALCQILK